MILSLIPAMVAAAVCAALNPVMAVICRRCGWIDRPDGGRKRDARLLPLSGGYAMAPAVAIGALVYFWQSPLPGMTAPLTWLGAGAAVALLLGFLDDGLFLGVRNKLLLQIAAALLACAGGAAPELVAIPGVETPVHLGYAAWPLAILWLLTCMNAINFLDGIDGLAAGLAVILSLTMAAVAGIYGNYLAVAIGVATAGAALGFLPFNAAPARAFMGDAGSMLLGYLIGVGWLLAAHQPNGQGYNSAIPLVALALPLTDISFTVYRRWHNKLPLTAAEPGHIHHAILRQNPLVPAACLRLYALAGIHAAAAIVLTQLRGPSTAMMTVTLIGFTIAVFRQYGCQLKGGTSPAAR